MSTGCVNFVFTMVPDVVMERVEREKVRGNCLAILFAIVREIMKYPETRETMTKELSCRYIGNKLGMDFSSVAKGIKKLVKKNFIEIIQVGKDKTGSLIRLLLNLPGEEEKKKVTEQDKGQVENNSTKENKKVEKKSTQNNFSVDNFSTNQINLNKKIDQEKTEDSFISEKTIKIAGNILQESGISNISDIVKNIADYIFTHQNSIHNPDAYLISSCKNYGKKDVKNLLPAAGQAKESVKEVVVRKNSFAGTFEQWEKEKAEDVDYLEAVEVLKKSFPKEYERVEGIVSEKLAGQKFVFSVDKARRILEEFKAVYKV